MARTFSHMARARLDHAVARHTAEAEALEGEKWEMRRAPAAPCTTLGWCPSLKHLMSIPVFLIAQTQAGEVFMVSQP